MNQNLFEMYIGVTINFQKEPDYEYLVSNYKVPGCICISHAAIRSLLQKQHLYRPRRS